MARYVVIGAGIVGLATAYEIVTSRPDADVTVLEKEDRVAAHQTGHNSGVIHAGAYYQPGSLKARLCQAGNRSMKDFCREHDIPVRLTGKLIVATEHAELARLHSLHQRALANGLPAQLISPEEAREHEPNVACIGAMRIASTGITDFAAVCRTLAELLRKSGATVTLGARVTGIRADRTGTRVQTTAGDLAADVLINCAGLHADRIARLAGVDPQVRIVPFRGEYYELRPGRRHLVNGLIYPVPEPKFPFLGVHLTAMIDGSVHAGPNAVLALAREGYHWRDIHPGDLAEAAFYPGLWQLARRHLRYGISEVHRSLSKRRFAASLARLVPAVAEDDLVPAAAGVRAQALTSRGDLVDDFLITVRASTPGHAQVHVLNAPSPAATSSLEIARHIVARLPA